MGAQARNIGINQPTLARNLASLAWGGQQNFRHRHRWTGASFAKRNSLVLCRTPICVKRKPVRRKTPSNHQPVPYPHQVLGRAQTARAAPRRASPRTGRQASNGTPRQHGPPGRTVPGYKHKGRPGAKPRTALLRTTGTSRYGRLGVIPSTPQYRGTSTQDCGRRTRYRSGRRWASIWWPDLHRGGSTPAGGCRGGPMPRP